MARREKPCTKDEFKYAHLMSDRCDHVVIDGVEMTAENIWNWPGDRNELVERLVEHFHSAGLALYAELSDGEIVESMLRLKSEDPASAVDPDGFVKNTGRLGLDVCR